VNQTTNITASLPPLIGREAMLSEGLAALRKTRLLTLTGPGGSGKTRLAEHMAHSLAYGSGHREGSDTSRDIPYREGVWWIDLTGCRDASHLSHAVLSALLHASDPSALSLITSPRLPDTVALASTAHIAMVPDLSTLLTALRRRRLLLVLDSCEHLLPSCTHFVELLLGSCPHLSILATSRERLKTAYEQVWPVSPLTVPSLGEHLTAEQAIAYSSIALFVQRATAIDPHFHFGDELVAPVAQICRILDGLPLATELAAGCVTFLTPQQIACQLEQGFSLLVDAGETASGRHQALEATMAWSYHLLTAPEQMLFRHLSVLSDSFDLELVSALDVKGTHETTFQYLRHLIDKALVIVLSPEELEPGERDEGVARYRIPHMLRHYGRQQLANTGVEEERETLERYCLWVEKLIQTAAPMLEGKMEARWLDRLEGNIGHLRAALQWLLEEQQFGRALSLMSALSGFWRLRGYLDEGRHWLERALRAQESRRGDDPSLSPTSTLATAQALNALGVFLMWQGAYDQAHQAHSQALTLFEQLEFSRGIAMTLFRLGFLADRRGDYDCATAYFNRSRYLFIALGDDQGRDVVDNRRGVTAWNQGLYDEATALLVSSLAFKRVQGHLGGMAATLLNLGQLALEQGHARQGMVYLEESLRLNQQIQDHLATAYALTYLGIASLLRYDVKPAVQRFKEALATLSELDLAGRHAIPELISRLIDSIAVAAARQGRAVQSARLWGAMETLRKECHLWYRPCEQQRYAAEAAIARHSVDSQIFSAAWSAGELMSLEAAVAFSADLLSSLSSRLHGTLPVPAPISTEVVAHLSPVESMYLAPSLHVSWQEGRKSGSNLVTALEHHPAGAEGATLRLRGLGTVGIYRGEDLITPTFRYKKAQEFLFYLLTYPNRTKEQIALALWPDATAEYVQTTFRVVLYHLRHALGGGQWIVREQQFYAFNRSLGYWYDVEAFTALTRSASQERPEYPERALASLNAAILLYPGDFGGGLAPSEWIIRQQEALHTIYIEALLERGELLLSLGAVRQALGTFHSVIDVERYCEAAHRGAIRCYLLLQELGAAKQLYERLCRSLEQDLAARPSPETQALAQNSLTLIVPE
jgi:predicted ATPase/DNA-binding SARP family transcriptional activator/Tfp pilus assembly protein PilF